MSVSSVSLGVVVIRRLPILLRKVVSAATYKGSLNSIAYKTCTCNSSKTVYNLLLWRSIYCCGGQVAKQKLWLPWQVYLEPTQTSLSWIGKSS
jgi:hypothetical protein